MNRNNEEMNESIDQQSNNQSINKKCVNTKIVQDAPKNIESL